MTTKPSEEKKPSAKDEKRKSDQVISEAMKEICKKYGSSAIMKLGDEAPIEVEVFPTGSISLDFVFGAGGLPRGRIIEVSGRPGDGKSTCAMYLVSQVQKAGGKAAYIDAEFTFSTSYAKLIGVDTDTMFLSQPGSGEEALDIVDTLAKTNQMDLIVVDSVAALVPKAELEGTITDQQIGLQARMMSKALRMLTGTLSKSKTTVLFVNQIRDNIGVFGYGPKTTTPGGNALKFYCSVRLEVKKVKTLKNDAEVRGNIIKVTATKNKVATPYKEATMTILFGKGIDKGSELLEWGLLKEVVKREGTGYFYGERKIASGEEKAAAAITEDAELAKAIEADIRKKVFLDAPCAKVQNEDTNLCKQ